MPEDTADGIGEDGGRKPGHSPEVHLNEVTVAARDYEASCSFYLDLGFTQIVTAPPRYASFEAPNGATFSFHADEASPSGTVIFFETEAIGELFEDLKERSAVLIAPPQDQSWLWREARVEDPAGNMICFYSAGPNWRFPPVAAEGHGDRLNQLSALAQAPHWLSSRSAGRRASRIELLRWAGGP
jgi:hydroxymethylpyrimidine/phosphomethylpyrimidine kinase